VRLLVWKLLLLLLLLLLVVGVVLVLLPLSLLTNRPLAPAHIKVRLVRKRKVVQRTCSSSSSSSSSSSNRVCSGQQETRKRYSLPLLGTAQDVNSHTQKNMQGLQPAKRNEQRDSAL
jgi:hypothetical protein